MGKAEKTRRVATKRPKSEAKNPSSPPATSPASKKQKHGNGSSDTSEEQVRVNPSTGTQDIVKKVAELRQATASSIAAFKFNKKRVRVISEVSDVPDACQGILYWMSRDQRVQDNWALLYAQRLAMKLEIPLHVCFCLLPKFSDATIRHFHFMLRGLEEVEQELKLLDIPFHLLIGQAKDVLPSFVRDGKIGGLVTDFCPLRGPLKWLGDVVQCLPEIPICQVDAHNIVPCWEASPKLEYGARTIRPKITKLLPTFLTGFPPLIKHPHQPKTVPEPVDWHAAEESLDVDCTVGDVAWATPGTTAGLLTLQDFCATRLKHFEALRNNPNKAALSNLSPWIHFGQISAQRAALIVRGYRSKYSKSVEAYIEESVIRRELSDNFCFYNEHYDTIEGTNNWARETLKVHAKDKREYVYSKEELEKAKTHDDLWNAAQVQLVKEAKMHGFLRMYWAKKILEWTMSPEEALQIAIYLNDKYSLDGRDPNGYVGCMWSICGIHDQGWAERPVFGKIRYMNYNGCKRKFDVALFVQKYKQKL